jgi:hypothetical protein
VPAQVRFILPTHLVYSFFLQIVARLPAKSARLLNLIWVPFDTRYRFKKTILVLLTADDWRMLKPFMGKLLRRNFHIRMRQKLLSKMIMRCYMRLIFYQLRQDYN